MFFNPVVLKDVFNAEDRKKLIEVIESDEPDKDWNDFDRNRKVKKYKKLELYFSKKLEKVAKEIFNVEGIKTTYSVYLDYASETSSLPMHKDNNACTYTISYCLSAKTPWPIVIGDKEYCLNPNEGVAFMGGHDSHGRPPMPDPKNNRVEIIMFHFCRDDHWFFTEGPEYIYTLADTGKLPDGDSYHLTPRV